MNENEKPLEGEAPEIPGASEMMEGTVAALDETVESANRAAAEAASEAEASIESLAAAAVSQEPEVAEASVAREEAAAPEPARPALAAPKQENGGRRPTITDRLAEDSEYDPDATNDDRIMAALGYASQLIIPLLIPIIILISETSKKRPFQRYHAIQAIAVSCVIWTLEIVLAVLSSVSLASFILWACLCFIVPAMIVLWLLPLYYAILAYNGKRFSIPGLTQFLKDQRWL